METLGHQEKNRTKWIRHGVYSHLPLHRLMPPLIEGQGKDCEGDDRLALNMAAFRIPCLLREPYHFY